MEDLILTVSEKVVETPSCTTIRFKQPKFRKLVYRSGQYLTVIPVIGGRKYRRAYSLSSVFGRDITVDITVKLIENGIVSNYLVNELKVGDALQVSGPLGEYVLPAQDDSSTVVFCWSAGSGIAPNFSILRHILLGHTSQKVRLVYSNRNYRETIFHAALENLKQEFPSRLELRYIHTRPDEFSVGVSSTGRLCERTIVDLVPSVDPGALHFICGSEGFNQTVRSALIALGTPEKNILVENFHNTIDPLELEEVVSAIAQVSRRGQVKSIPVKKGINILDACLDNGIDAEYSCQSGSCTLCKARLISGAVKRISSSEPDEALAADEILTCCSFPLTGELELSLS